MGSLVKSRGLFLFLCLLFVVSVTAISAEPATSTEAKKPYIIFINPASKNNQFWEQVSRHMGYAATSLGFRLEIRNGNDSPLYSTKLAINAMEDQEKPDFLVVHFANTTMQNILDSAEKNHVKVLTFNAGPAKDLQDLIGHPRQKYHYWLAHLWPNDVLAGQLEAEYLLNAAEQRWPNAKEHQILAFNGAKNGVSLVALERSEGLAAAIAHDPKARLAQEFGQYWDTKQATQPLLNALKRHPEARLLWAASDAMGIMIHQRLKEAGLDPNQYLIGGMDATPPGIDAVERGDMVTTVGGHFIEGAWCMVLIYDYLHQHDFSDVAVEYRTDMKSFDRPNTALLKKLYATHAFTKLDFHRFTRADSQGKRTGYDFSWNNLLDEFRRQGLLDAK